MNKKVKKSIVLILPLLAICAGAYALLGNSSVSPTDSENSKGNGTSTHRDGRKDIQDARDVNSSTDPQNPPSDSIQSSRNGRKNRADGTLASAASISEVIIDESKTPNGRYRNQVFSNLTTQKDITYVTRYRTRLTEDSPTNYLLSDDTNQLVDLKLNIYRPANDPLAKRPLIIFVYGGGWVFGDRYQQEASAEYYAKMGYATMTIDYTMLPADAPAPIPTEDYSVYTGLIKRSGSDLYAAYQFAAAHSQEYGFDASRIGFAGWSAGGLISASVANIAAFPAPSGLRAVVGASSTMPAFLTSMHEISGGFKTFDSSYNPINMLVSYDEDTGFGGAENDHAADCSYLDSIGHRCLTVTYPGAGHEQEFYQAPLLDNTVPFLAQYLAGY